MISRLEKLRLEFEPKLPEELNSLQRCAPVPYEEERADSQQVRDCFSEICGLQPLKIAVQEPSPMPSGLRVGVVFSGGQAPGGHNVITGLFDALKKLDPASRLFGFLGGPSGIVKNQCIELTEEKLAAYRNQGGFDLIGSGRTKIETPAQFDAALNTMRALSLDGLVVIGGDDSNTNAALLAHYFLQKGEKIAVVGVPKTIDGDLKNRCIEASFGFDTASKTYSEAIGNLMRDALSARKYYYFVKLMGRSASHITLECALQTHPNLAFIGEEVAAQNKTLVQLVNQLCDLVIQRTAAKKDYGVILIPEGLLEFIPEVKLLIQELNQLLAPENIYADAVDKLSNDELKIDYISKFLSSDVQRCFRSLTKEIQAQLLLGRDAHGNVQVSKIETERLLIDLVKKELKKRAKLGEYSGAFSPQPFFFGYEGRACLPSNFDAEYCYALGHVAALLIRHRNTGYICSITNLHLPVEKWQAGAVPLTSMMGFEKRHGELKPVISKALVDLDGRPFKAFDEQRASWMLQDDYVYPGPVQFFGPVELTDSRTCTLELEAQQGRQGQ